MTAAEKILRRAGELAKISDEPGAITRIFASPAMARANELAARWMREAGMTTRIDAVGNLLGRYEGAMPNAKALLMGSHLDTVRNAGKFDGPLGVLLAIACVENLHRTGRRLPFAVEVAGFADEEGVRFQTACLGSRALAGLLAKKDLRRVDADGVSMAAALKQFGGDPKKLQSARVDPRRLIGYVEAHIEQGPLLERKKSALGIVRGIAGQTRASLRFAGCAGHAGTTPMRQRKDALCAAAEFISTVESLARSVPGLVATVGQIAAAPGASNVIPGEVRLSLDVRHEHDAARQRAQATLKAAAARIARRRSLRCGFELVQETPTVAFANPLTALLAQSVKRRMGRLLSLSSGAGHDAGVMAGLTPAAMLFVRCKNGLSHHPAESVEPRDVQAAYEVLGDFLLLLAANRGEKESRPGSVLC